MSARQSEVINKLKDKGITLLGLDDLQRVLEIQERNTVQKLAQRLVASEVLERIKRGKYLFLHNRNPVTDFQLANFLWEPSYISLGSTLVHHGVLDQFTYKITSVTTRNTKTLTARGKTFAYPLVTSEMYWDYVNERDFLIATPEKALIDIIYLSGKSDHRLPKNIHTKEPDKKRLSRYLNRLESGRYPRKLRKLGIEIK